MQQHCNCGLCNHCLLSNRANEYSADELIMNFMSRTFSTKAPQMSEAASAVVTKVKKTPIVNFKQWRFLEKPSYATLPIDNNAEYNIPVAVHNAVFSKVPTEPLQGKVHLVCASDNVLKEILDLDPSVSKTELFIKFINGCYLPKGSLVVAHRYGGHQFGFWSDQLGDGRAHILGEYLNRNGDLWQPQLKGSGETPYSRFGDGRAVLRSSIREMIGSEACYYLDIPTTRAVGLVVSDDHKVWRDKNYSGHAKQERAAILMRLAPAWYRVGSFEILSKRCEYDLLKTLLDFIIDTYYPKLRGDKYISWFREVAKRNIDMVAAWQGLGFTHGVFNTDNMSVFGLTIDYGPFGFIDHYNRYYVPNSSDGIGRYAFHKQPEILMWNLEKLLEAIKPVLSDLQKKLISGYLKEFEDHIKDKILAVRLNKIGLTNFEPGDQKLVDDLFNIMQLKMADFTATFRQLSEVHIDDLLNKSVLETKWALKKFMDTNLWENWVIRYRERVKLELYVKPEKRSEFMKKLNPLYVPRNWIMQEAIADAENNDFKKVRFLLKLFENPYEVNEEAEELGYSSQPPSWAYGLKLSCSS